MTKDEAIAMWKAFTKLNSIITKEERAALNTMRCECMEQIIGIQNTIKRAGTVPRLTDRELHDGLINLFNLIADVPFLREPKECKTDLHEKK